MKKLRKILVSGLLVAGLASAAGTVAGGDCKAATKSPEASVQAASSDDVSTSSSSSSTDRNYALIQQASGDWRDAVEYIDKTDADDAETYHEAYNHHKKRTEESDDDDDDEDDDDDDEDEDEDEDDDDDGYEG